MVSKARSSASQWDSGIPMVPLKPSESGDVCLEVVCLSVGGGCSCILLYLDTFDTKM